MKSHYKKAQKRANEQWDGVRNRIEYLCDLVFGGNAKAFARHIKIDYRSFSKFMTGVRRARFWFIARIAHSGLANAEWLLAGTGPVRPGDRALPIELPPPPDTSFPLFDTRQVKYSLPEKTSEAPLRAVTPEEIAIRVAQRIYTARNHDKPVILFLDDDAITSNIGPTVAEMMRKGYVTGVAVSSAAAERDLERALFGGWAAPHRASEAFNTLLNAADMAARNGLGWGLAAGRWCFPNESDRAASVLACGYELGLPVTIHLNLGDCVSHLFPSLDGAARGAALGAASYIDLLIFAEQVRKLATMPHHGVHLNTGSSKQGDSLIFNAIEAATGTLLAGLPTAAFENIGEEYRHTFPALLAACDAVYDGTADNGR